MAEYIDREKIIDRIKQEPTDGMFTDEILQAINEIPAEAVTPIKRGEWLIHERQAPKGRKIKYSIKQCSVCGKYNGRHSTNYCPNCGAKMDGDVK